MLSSMSAAATSAVKKWFFNISETTRASNFKMYNKVALNTRYWRHNLLPIGSKSHKRIKFGSCSGRDFSMTVHTISKRVTILETVIQELYYSFCDQPSSTQYINGWFRFYRKLLKIATRKFTQAKHRMESTSFTRNNVISYFGSAANPVHTTAPVTDFTVAKWSFLEYLGK